MVWFNKVDFWASVDIVLEFCWLSVVGSFSFLRPLSVLSTALESVAPLVFMISPGRSTETKLALTLETLRSPSPADDLPLGEELRCASLPWFSNIARKFDTPLFVRSVDMTVDIFASA